MLSRAHTPTLPVGLHFPGGRSRRTRARDPVRATMDRRSLLSGLTTPLVYLQFIPFFALDLSVSLYQWLCFPVYGISRVARRPYFALDRHTLPYLSLLERANCAYCGYANGVIAYTREVTARTEAYWCPIKHRRRTRDPHRLYRRFLAFGDASGYRRSLETHRTRNRTRRGAKAPDV